MKQYDENKEYDKTLKSLDSITMGESDKEDVYSDLIHSIEKKKGIGRGFNWPVQLLSAAFIMIFLVGGGYLIAEKILWEQAAPEDENIETIETVLDNVFSGPDKELKKLLDDQDSYIEEDKAQEYQSNLYSYYENIYQPYFEENTFQGHINTNQLTFTQLAYYKGYQLKADKINVKEDEKTDGAYNFTVNVHYYKGDIKEGDIKVTGRVNIYNTGKINTLKFYDDGGLEELIKIIQ
ncbi:hypothetical protein FZC79_22535 [Rossellomorea vietnamensis]|uniref:Uncharacterized protein n=1 Tax=Rossellomorea vietnamensis TaxID=218284 RepID=A0A5D4K6W0_9BACI|nr:hypothetical protein [Rossellomorea vietnamensis]TYR72495.1 hypothetical protein FZC79_22535 [Rossellomorea vietnamensis]